MDNPENTKKAIKWTIQRIPKGKKGQSRGYQRGKKKG